jgi:hypothetical protein
METLGEIIGGIFILWFSLGLIYIMLFGLNQFLFSKFHICLKAAMGLNSGRPLQYVNAKTLFHKFPTQKKVDVLVKYGMYAEGAKLIPVTVGSNPKTLIVSRYSNNHAILARAQWGGEEWIITLIETDYDFVAYRLVLEDGNTLDVQARSWRNPFAFDYCWYKRFESDSDEYSTSCRGAKMCRELLRLRKN